jgi:hypothetical protein
MQPRRPDKSEERSIATSSLASLASDSGFMRTCREVRDELDSKGLVFSHSQSNGTSKAIGTPGASNCS